MSYNGRESGSINGREPPLGQYVETARYVVFKENGVIKVKNGLDGSIDYSGSDASTVIQNAIDSLNDYEKILFKGGNVFTIRQPLQPKSNTVYQINGTLKTHDGVSSDLASDFTAPSDTVEVVDGSKFEVGDWVAVTDDSEPVDKQLQLGESAVISSIDGDTITLDRELQTSYQTADNAYMGTVNTTVYIGDGKKNIAIIGQGVIDGNLTNQNRIAPVEPGGNEAEWRLNCLSVYGSTTAPEYITIRGIKVMNAGLHGITISEDTKDWRISHVEVDYALHKNILLFNADRGQLNNIRTHHAVEEEGIAVYGQRNTRMSFSNIHAYRNGRYGVMIAGDQHRLTNVFVHHNTEEGLRLNNTSSVTVNNLVTKNNQFGILVRRDEQADEPLMLNNCYVYDNSYGISLQHNNYTVFNNVIIRANDGYGIFMNNINNVSFVNCRALNNTDEGFYIKGVDTRLHNTQAIGNGTNIRDEGTRTVIEGLGKNAGDPSATGDWNGYGYEGLIIRDTTNANTYIYNNGVWSQIASA